MSETTQVKTKMKIVASKKLDEKIQEELKKKDKSIASVMKEQK